MASVMIKCPKTGQAVPTGIGTTKEGWEAMQMSGNSTICPACGSMHTWDKKDAFLQEDKDLN